MQTHVQQNVMQQKSFCCFLPWYTVHLGSPYPRLYLINNKILRKHIVANEMHIVANLQSGLNCFQFLYYERTRLDIKPKLLNFFYFSIITDIVSSQKSQFKTNKMCISCISFFTLLWFRKGYNFDIFNLFAGELRERSQYDTLT